ncbi:MAG: efflux RND transporter periplasmic adaptor subunit [Thermodesulfobacteriota bacterium]
MQFHRILSALAACALLCLWTALSLGAAPHAQETAATSVDPLQSGTLTKTDGKTRVRSSVIAPYRSATVPSEVSGVVEAVLFQEGDRMESGRPVVEVSAKRYAAMTEAIEKRLASSELTLALARQKMSVKEALLVKDWSTRQKLIEAEEEVAIATANREAVLKDLAVSRLDLAACTVRAPFTGYLAARYVEPFEAVERLGRLFAIVDTSKVYAVGHVPEAYLSRYQKGTKTIFTYVSGEQFSGTVERVAPVITPESKTARIWVLIDNPKDELKVGMTGTLDPE